MNTTPITRADGAFAAGVLKSLVDAKAFEKHEIFAFSGTSAGAVIATSCWGHNSTNTIKAEDETGEGSLGDTLTKQWEFAVAKTLVVDPNVDARNGEDVAGA